MNVFKLLSRSSKALQTTPSQKLPSSGAAANPQLFGHDETEPQTHEPAKSRKRKRGSHVTEPTAALEADIDYFGGASGSSKSKRKNENSTNGMSTAEETMVPGSDVSKNGNREGDGSENSTEPYNEDESKRILRSHKLKIVVLEDFAAQAEDSPKDDKKKSKKRKREKEKAAEDGKKKEKRQLWPQPLTSFTQLKTRYGISRRLAENIAEQGYTTPTEVQLGALTLLLRKKNVGQNESAKDKFDVSGSNLAGDIDLLAVAPTGSGKTIAFLIPIIDSLLSNSKSSIEADQGPHAIIVAPTKELASQIVNEARKLTRGTGIKATLMQKGMEVVERPIDENQDEDSESAAASDDEDNISSSSEDDEKTAYRPKRVRRRAEIVKAAILVATPLALLNALKRGDEVSTLPSIQHLVLDEADVLLDPLFRDQTLSIWSACTNPSLRVGLWSATMGSNIESLAISTLNTRWSNLSSSATSSSPLPSRSPLIRLVVGLKDTAIPNITHKLIYAGTEQGKLLGLRQLLHPTAQSSKDSSSTLRPPFLIFTQTIPRAIALHSELLYDIPPEAGGSSRISVLHSSLSSSARSNIMRRFRQGEVWVLITTDLLSRGVDFRGLNGVVNYDVPSSSASYVHRVGRTGRAGREGGVAVTFYTREDIPYVKNVANVIAASEKQNRTSGSGNNSREGEGVQQWLLDALPDVSKKDKQMLKRRGVEARRRVKDDEGKGKGRISTKSGYERRKENNLRGAKRASANRAKEERRPKAITSGGEGAESEFEGFD